MEDDIPSPTTGFGRLLRRYRLAAGLSQEALAERAQMSTEAISALERSFRRSPQRQTLELLVGALALDPEQQRDFQRAARTAAARRKGASVTVGPWPLIGRTVLPIPVTSYVGRENDTAAIVELLRERRFVTLTGEAGIGKTRAALEAVVALGEDWESPPCFISLISVTDASSVQRVIASALGIQEAPNRALGETLRSHLESKFVLLILDNCEHVIGEAAAVAEMLVTGCPGVRILATSREPLRVAGEHAYRLPTLAVPPATGAHRRTATALLEYGAVRLFWDRARAVNHFFELTDERASLVAELSRRLDGIPLAIELAAARANSVSIETLAVRLGERFRLLAGGERTAIGRQQTMRAAIDWSYGLLSEPEQRVFERLSVFAGGASQAMATQVCGNEGAEAADALDLLSSLTDKSLVIADVNSGETRYRLLESFREYAREKLAARGELKALLRRHAVAYLELARQIEHLADTDLDKILSESIAREFDNWRAALRWTILERNDTLLGQELAGELNGIWLIFAPLDGRRWLELAAEQVDERTPLAVLAVLKLAQSANAQALGEYLAQLGYAKAALAHYQALGDPIGIAHAQLFVGDALFHTGKSSQGSELLHEGLAALRRLEIHRLVAFALRCLGRAHAHTGDFGTAHRYSSEAVQIFEALGVVLPAVAARKDLAQYALLMGNPELAARDAASIIEVWRRANGAARPLAIMLNDLAVYLIVLDRYGEAEASVHEALDICVEHGLRTVAATALQHLAVIAVLRNRGEGAGKRWTDAARVLGYADAQTAAGGSKPWRGLREERDRAMAGLREVLAAVALAEALAAGAAMSEEDAMEAAEAL